MLVPLGIANIDRSLDLSKQSSCNLHKQRYFGPFLRHEDNKRHIQHILKNKISSSAESIPPSASVAPSKSEFDPITSRNGYGACFKARFLFQNY